MNDPSTQPVAVELALISHTNSGKTTLARTLLARDIGVVRDAPHVTEFATSHVLLRTPAGDELRLWDTPGFGDSARLVSRLRTADNPIGWLLREVWDRFRDRPFWCSQQAIRAARDSSDVVLYLVNAAEKPQDAGYLEAEIQVLRWLDKPVLILLNQMGPPRPSSDERAEQARWRDHFDKLGYHCDVLTLDAFARCWVQEGELLAAVAARLPAVKRVGFERLRLQWTERSIERYEASMQQLAAQMARAACDSEPVDVGDASIGARVLVTLGLRGQDGARNAATAALAQRLDEGIRASTEALIELHQLEGSAGATVLDRVQRAYAIQEPIPEGRAALFGGVLTGALTGLKADLATGGLSMGTGMLVGALVGGLGGAGLARGINRLTGSEQVLLSWPDEFLDGLMRSGVLRYLAVAHYGRGRGEYVEGEAPAFWHGLVQQALQARVEMLHALWALARQTRDPDRIEAALVGQFAAVATEVLDRLYPRQVPARLKARGDAPLPVS